jgi:hypothetical protein
MPVRAILLLVLGPKGGRFDETVSGKGLAGNSTSGPAEFGAMVLKLMDGLIWVTSRRPGDLDGDSTRTILGWSMTGIKGRVEDDADTRTIDEQIQPQL